MTLYSDGRETAVTRTKRAELAAENRRLREQIAALTAQLTALQAANEGAYRQAHEATDGPGFDRRQPFPTAAGLDAKAVAS